ncbi:hypothetical protein NCER_100361 [Vairimorpha ceranae BRL01]|uniref:Uncharacterized protein n=1 Tax=Vairimorpha ceranae (strain BRL01) TaxID=578460 RepID=C4V7D4_VAIC1|nr:hypothetical protein NCER_100361 [Vairimorpha ceranae BRL01]
MNLLGSIVGISGGNGGLGLALVKILVNICEEVVVVDSSDMCQELSELPNVSYVRCDLLKERPRPFTVDVFIANVGMSMGPKLVKDAEFKEMCEMIALNISSHLWFFKNVKHKKFVFIDSVLAFNGMEYYSMYCACKSFIHTFNEGLQREGHDTLIVYPYKINTDMFKEIKDYGTLDVNNVAESVVDAIKTDKKSLFLPRVFTLTETIKGALPSFVKNWVLDRISKYFLSEVLEGAAITTEEKERAPITTEEKEKAPIATEEKEKAPIATEEKKKAPITTEEKEKAPTCAIKEFD